MFFSVKRRIRCNISLICSIFLLAGSFIGAQESDNSEIAINSIRQHIQRLPGSEKLIEQEKIFQSYEIQESAQHGMMRVIVTLASHKRLAEMDLTETKSIENWREDVAATQMQALSALNSPNLEIVALYENFPCFSALVGSEELAELMANPLVDKIEPERYAQMHLAQGIPMMNAAAVRSRYDGSGMSIAIIDSGVDYTHPRLGGGGFPNSKVIGGYDTSGAGDADPMPVGSAHGTCCAGIAAGDTGTVGDYIGGVAPGAKIMALKVFPDNVDGASFTDIIEAIDWCVTNKNLDPDNPIVAISMSLGGGQAFSVCDALLPSVEAAAASAVAAGITVLASSGNDGYCDSMGGPACVSSIVSVGAVYDASFG